MDTEQTKPKYLLPWCCPKCGVDCSASELGTKDYDNAIGYYLHCHACDVNFTHWENETRRPHCGQIDGQEYVYPREASPATDVSDLVDGYEDIKNAFGNQIVPLPDYATSRASCSTHDVITESASRTVARMSSPSGTARDTPLNWLTSRASGTGHCDRSRDAVGAGICGGILGTRFCGTCRISFCGNASKSTQRWDKRQRRPLSRRHNEPLFIGLGRVCGLGLWDCPRGPEKGE